MKVNIKEKLNIKRVFRNGKDKVFHRKSSKAEEFFADSFSEADSFGAMVHSSTPILVMKDSGKRVDWTKDLLLNGSNAVLMTAILALFCMCIDTPFLILFTLPCAVVYMAIATVGTLKPGRLKWIIAAVMLVIMIAVAAVWHGTVLGGLSMLINQFYDIAEEAQAYIYDRLPGGDASELAGELGIAWFSCLFGLLTALPPAEVKRKLSGLIVIAVMFAFAYYGLIPSVICIAVVIAALIAAVSRGSILSIIPVALVALLIFGALVLADPGESYGISRMDENFRDRFAFRSALLETQDPFVEDTETEREDEMEDPEDDESEDGDYDSDYGAYAALGILILCVAVCGAGGYLFYRRMSKRRAENRRGIDSKDNREAVTAMFPYALRWIKGYGIEQTSASVMSMIPELKNEFSDSYTSRFRDMYKIWSEAAYSDHEVSEDARELMDSFMNDTIKQVKDRCKLRDLLRLRIRYAL